MDKPSRAYLTEVVMKNWVIAVIVGAQSIIAMPVWAISDKCEIVESEGNRLILECKHETDGFEEGKTVKIKTVRKSGAIEGC